MKIRTSKTEIELSYFLICLIAIILIIGDLQRFVFCLFSVIIHEAGHILMMAIFKTPPEKIKISAFEISISDKQRQSRSKKQNLLIIFFGPFVNFICFICFFLLYLFCNKVFLPLAVANISVCIFNMLPVLSLDGGQLIYILLSFKFEHHICDKVVNIITFIFIFPLAVLGFFVLFKSKYNFSLLFVCIYLVASLVMRNNKYY